MIIDITTGLFPRTGQKPGRPWQTAQWEPALTCPLRAPVKDTWGEGSAVASRGNKQWWRGGGGYRSPCGPSEPPGDSPCLNLSRRNNRIANAQLLKHHKSPIACSRSVTVCAADLPSARKQRATRAVRWRAVEGRGGGATADMASILPLNNTFHLCSLELRCKFHTVTAKHFNIST